jgi:DNA processing protein
LHFPDGALPAAPRTVAAQARWLRDDDPHWPPLWRTLDVPPPAVHACGMTGALARPCLGIVGTRNATPRGLAFARDLAQRLSAAGWVITSGLARGIDAAAHKGALDAGGLTVAVMATGNDGCYPYAHRGLLAQVRAQGCSITQFRPGTPPLKHHFLQRNELLAGLVHGVVVVEAPKDSGALDTARRALNAGREVFAVPGPVDGKRYEGCHNLLREGACLVEKAEHVLEVLGLPDRDGLIRGDAARAAATPPLPDHAAARWLWDRLDPNGTGRDELRRQWPGDEHGFIEGVTALELAGLIHRLPGGLLARRIWTG